MTSVFDPATPDAIQRQVEEHGEAWTVAHVAALRDRVAQLELALLRVMRSRYIDSGEPYAYHLGCSALDHPMRYDDGNKPPFKANRCFCGKVVDHAGVS
jgi:hypothetical protein